MRWLLCKFIRGYQIFLSPAFHFFGGPGSGCRFDPTCSQYCMDAIRVHGCLRGGWLGIRRLCRCQPWGPEGYDPVPGMEEADASTESPN